MISNTTEYKNLHQWVRRHLQKPEVCQSCYNKEPYDLANITGIYNRDLTNWIYMCRPCHMRYDFNKGIRKGHWEPRPRDDKGKFICCGLEKL